MNMLRLPLFTLVASALLLVGAMAADTCGMCATWNTPQKPFKLFGNAYYVGPHGLGSVLVTSDTGHILIDGALPESAPQIATRIKDLGFRLEDVKVILNSHVHVDHAGGIAELQRLTGATVKASPASAAVLKTGITGDDDPQHAILSPIPSVARIETIKDGETVRVGSLALTAHFTPGHTPGGTTWTWESCEGARCLHMVYADSLTAVSAPDYLFKDNPTAVGNFERSLDTVATLPCDILVSAHPEFSNLWSRLEKRDAGNASGLVDSDACKQYADRARTAFNARVAKEKSK